MSNEFPLVTFLTVLFVILKLTNVINWSWWWVFAPIWIGLGIVAVIVIIAIIFVILAGIIDGLTE